MKHNHRSLCAVILIFAQLFAPFADCADPVTEAQFSQLRNSLNRQNPKLRMADNGHITGFAQSSYQRMPRVTSHRAIRVNGGWGGNSTISDSLLWDGAFQSPTWKGVFLGREPAAQGDGQVEPLGVPSFEYNLLAPEEGEPQRVQLTFGLANGTTWSFDVAAAVVTPMTAAAMDGRVGFFSFCAPKYKDNGTPAVDVLGRPVRVPAINPALHGHLLAYRPAILDLFAESMNSAALLDFQLNVIEKDQSLSAEKKQEKKQIAMGRVILLGDRSHSRISKATTLQLIEQIEALNVANGESSLSAVIEKRWTLSPENLTSRRSHQPNDNLATKFVHRVVYEAGEGRYRELPASEAIHAEILKSLTASELQLVQEYNDAVVVYRIIYAVRQGWIVNFDRQQNWSKMIDDLEGVYQANMDQTINAEHLAYVSREWALYYNGKDYGIPEDMRLK